MPLKQRNTITKADFEEALDYLGSSISEVAKQTNIPRAYLSDLKNRNVRLRREHEDKLRTFLEDQGVEFESDEAPPGRRSSAAASSPHPSVEVTQVVRRSLALDDEQDNDAIAAALDSQADRDAQLSQLLSVTVERSEGLMFGPGDLKKSCKQSLDEARRLLAESYLVVGILRGLRGFKVTDSKEEPQTLGALLAKEYEAALSAAGLIKQPEKQGENEGSEVPVAAAPKSERKAFAIEDL